MITYHWFRSFWTSFRSVMNQSRGPGRPFVTRRRLEIEQLEGRLVPAPLTAFFSMDGAQNVNPPLESKVTSDYSALADNQYMITNRVFNGSTGIFNFTWTAPGAGAFTGQITALAQRGDGATWVRRATNQIVNGPEPQSSNGGQIGFAPQPPTNVLLVQLARRRDGDDR
jgi:hypothetical protein